MRALLVRVGADCTDAGGRWNGPVDRTTGAFAYVPIPEPEPVRETSRRRTRGGRPPSSGSAYDCPAICAGGRRMPIQTSVT